jgi:hypothetical protein
MRWWRPLGRPMTRVNLDVWEHGSHVERCDPAVHRLGGSGRHAESLITRVPGPIVGVVGQRGRGEPEDLGREAPVLIPAVEQALTCFLRHPDRVVIGPLPPSERVDERQ